MDELTIAFKIESPPSWLPIGRTAENNWRAVEIDCSYWFNMSADGSVVLMYKPSCGMSPYPLLTEREGDNIIWRPKSGELVEGVGRLQAFFEVGTDVIGSSEMISCEVDSSLLGVDPGTDPGQTDLPWALGIIEQIAELSGHYPKIIDGNLYIWDSTLNEWVEFEASGGGAADAVLYTPQTLTSAQKAQARGNVGAISADDLAYVTPEQFGAVGDGVADDTAAVRQAMQNPAVALQKTYKVTEAITCAAQLVQGIDGGGIVSSAGGLVFANDTRLVDFSASLPHGYDGNVIEAKGSVYADGLTVTGGKVGILASGQYKAVEIRNCSVSDQWGESSRGIYVPFAGETLIEGNKVDTVANDTTVNADGISVWQSKEEQHPTVVIRGNTIHNCRGRFIKASTRDAVVGSNYCYNDSDFEVIPYFVAIDVQNGCSIVRGNTVIAPSGINVSLRDTAGLHSVHAIEYNKLVYNGVSASNKTMIATTDYANGNASAQVSIVGNDITAQANNSASIQLAYVPSAKYNIYSNRVRGGTWYAMQMKGTFDATTRLEVLGNTNADYAYFARFVGGMPNVKGDCTARCETALDFASVLRDTSFTANATAIDGFTNVAFVRGRDGATGHWIELWDGSEVGGYKTNGQQIFYHKQGENHVSSVNGLSGDVTLTIPTAVSELTNDSGFVTAQQAAAAAPVQSVNGKTGPVTLDASDVGALPSNTPIPAAVTEQTVAGWGFTKNTGDYSKPSGGIPKTDLASDVRTSLGKADSALQTAPVTSVNGMTGDVVITVDSALSSTSENPVQNKVIKARFDALATFTDGEAVVPLFTNVIPISIDSNNSIFNGIGYQNGKRINSSGDLVDATGGFVTGFIPLPENPQNMVMRFSGIHLIASGGSTNSRIQFYDASFNSVTGSQTGQGTLVVAETDSDGYITRINFADQTASQFTPTAAMKYVRFCAYGSGEGGICTINEEIAYDEHGEITSVALKPDVSIQQLAPLDARITALEEDEGGGTIDSTDPLVKYAKQIDNGLTVGYEPTLTGRPTAYLVEKKYLNFLHISDTHGSVNAENAVKILNKLKADGRCSFLIHTGDIHSSTFADVASWNAFAGYIAQANAPVLLVSGNHDVGNNSQSTTNGQTATDAQLYARCFEPYISGWNLTSHPTGKCYWYKDFADEGVRLIGLYDFESDYATDSTTGDLLYKRGYAAYHQAQIDWLVQALLSCPAGYGVIIAKHNPMNLRGTLDNPFNGEFLQGQNTSQSYVSKDMIAEIVQAFMDGTTINKTFAQRGNVTDTLTVNQDFSGKNSGAHFVCYLDGHTHADGVNFLADFPKQLELNIGCDNYHYQHYSDTLNQQGTLHQDLLNYVSVDVNRGYVYIQRIGNDFTGQADRRDFTAIDYRHPPEAVDLDDLDARVSALENTPQLELINTVTFDGETALNITTDSAGAPLRLTRAILRITMGTVAAASSITVDAKYANAVVGRWYSSLSAATGHRGMFSVWQDGSFWDSQFTSISKNVGTVSKQPEYTLRSVQPYPYIEKFVSVVVPPAGTVLEVYGVRA